MIVNTRDLAKFGHRERAIAGELLSTLFTGNDNAVLLGDVGIAVEFNLNSAMVFLVDEDGNVAVMEDDKLVDFLSCPTCGNEGTKSDMLNDRSFEKADDCCKEYLKEVYS